MRKSCEFCPPSAEPVGPDPTISGCRDSGRANAALALQITIKAGAADAQHLRGAHSITRAQLEDAFDMVFTNLFQRQRPPGFCPLCNPVRLLQIFRQVLQVNKVVRRHQGRAGNHVLELSYVAGPGMLQQHRLCSTGESLNLLALSSVIFLYKKTDQLSTTFA